MATENIALDGENALEKYADDDVELEASDDDGDSDDDRKPKLKPVIVKTPEYFEILRKIKEYKRVFPDECDQIELKNEEKLTIYDLQSKLEECKDASANRKNNKIHQLAFKAVLHGTELHLAPAFNMDLHGFANTALQDEDLLKTLDEIALLQDWSTKAIPPEQRLLLGLGTLAIRLNAQNKAEKKKESLKLPEKSENFDDL